MEPGEDAGATRLRPLPYHEAIREYLRTEEPEVWAWYASNKVRNEHVDAVRFDLLKSTYRLDRETHGKVYAAAEDVAARLGLNLPITLYQAQNLAGLNASLAYLRDEAHIVFHGPVVAKLSDAELQAVLGHELCHLLLWRNWDGHYLIADQILSALTHDSRAEAAHYASARLFGLYTEIFCDRGALLVVDDPRVVVSMLVKIQTELDEVNAESYIRQAEEIFSKRTTKTDQVTHPEAFIRARALTLWAEADAAANEKIAEMIEGAAVLDELDLLAQRRAVKLTRRVIDRLLSHEWMQTDAVLAHARMFFEDYTPPDSPSTDAGLADDLRTDDQPMLDYYCYVLLDFVSADRDLEELPLAAALLLAEQLELKDRFSEIAPKELRLRKRQFEKIDNQKQQLLSQAALQTATS